MIEMAMGDKYLPNLTLFFQLQEGNNGTGIQHHRTIHQEATASKLKKFGAITP